LSSVPTYLRSCISNAQKQIEVVAAAAGIEDELVGIEVKEWERESSTSRFGMQEEEERKKSQ
jgi:hypothetical protein